MKKSLTAFFSFQNLTKKRFSKLQPFFEKFKKFFKEVRNRKESVIKVLKVKPHEHPEVYMLKNTLEAMHEAVGGYIDILGLDDNVCILLNDEGNLIGLEDNRRISSDI